MWMPKAMLAIGLAGCVNVAWAATPDLGWLSAPWCGGDAGRVIQETWLAPVGGELIGVSRTSQGERMASFEFMRIVRDGAGVALRVQPDGDTPTVFPMAASGQGWIRFENAAHDFPNTIEYRRQGDRLHAWIAGPGEDGKPLRIAFDYALCPR